MNKKKIAIIIGVRPEAVKMAPVILEFKKCQDRFETLVIATAQHRQLLDKALAVFGIAVDKDLNVMTHNQSLSALTSTVIGKIEPVLQDLQPDLTLVQGDTTTALAAAMVCFYLKIPLGHVEAGLRSFDFYNPYPEEFNRKAISMLASLHFAPTKLSHDNLIKEGIPKQNIVIAGNTSVDALSFCRYDDFDLAQTPLSHIPLDDRRILLLTCHRRESWGKPLESICLAIKTLVNEFPDIQVLYPVHPNPNVKKTVHKLLGNAERIHIIEDLDYHAFTYLMKKSTIILTDSGGVVEEAPFFHKPTLVLRNATERPEAVMVGQAKLVGVDVDSIVKHCKALLTDAALYEQMAKQDNPFGDGKAAARIVSAVNGWFSGRSPILAYAEEFQSYVCH
jgi:UDP-N-acetylglucosamine 2-epimerase (non-hydrolysing)